MRCKVFFHQVQLKTNESKKKIPQGEAIFLDDLSSLVSCQMICLNSIIHQQKVPKNKKFEVVCMIQIQCKNKLDYHHLLY